MTLADLEAAAGTPARTIRFYIARGLLKGPLKAGRGASYTAEHLARIEQIKALQNDGHTLTEIAYLLEGASAKKQSAAPTPWWQHAIDQDVVVWVRADVSPWRLKQIRDAIDKMASRLEAANRKSDEE